LLQLDGHRVDVVTSAEAALATMKRDRTIDLVLCDVMMPTTRGPALVAEMRRQALRPTAVIFVSGKSAHELPCAGSSPFLGKPFTIDELRAAIRTATAGA
jgi:CheY-like chemotaxis protein